ncbi:galactose-3-O-sulfotransferase 2-like [Glandiceps talaboti]
MAKKLSGFFFLLCAIAFLALYSRSRTLTTPPTYRDIKPRLTIVDQDSTSWGEQAFRISYPADEDRNGSCDPVNNVVFAKTHKTGSSTLAGIFQRYGYLRNLSFILNPHTPTLSLNNIFDRGMALKSPPPVDFESGGPRTFNMLVSHVRFSRKEIESVIRPGAKYITIIRNPVTNLESGFGFFLLAKKLGLDGYTNPFEVFVRKIEELYEKQFPTRNLIRNGQLFDLGLSPTQQTNVTHIRQKILELANDFDLVLIMEHYEESLILLKRIMCWEFEDIMYFPSNIRSKHLRYTIDRTSEKKILEWSMADTLLYDFFNKTLWARIRAQGKGFYRDLEIFQKKQKELYRTCVDDGAVDNSDKRQDRLVLVANATLFCQLLRLKDSDYWKLLTQRQMMESLRRMNFTFTLH